LAFWNSYTLITKIFSFLSFSLCPIWTIEPFYTSVTAHPSTNSPAAKTGEPLQEEKPGSDEAEKGQAGGNVSQPSAPTGLSGTPEKPKSNPTPEKSIPEPTPAPAPAPTSTPTPAPTIAVPEATTPVSQPKSTEGENEKWFADEQTFVNDTNCRIALWKIWFVLWYFQYWKTTTTTMTFLG
jgi:hypothetical protein